MIHWVMFGDPWTIMSRAHKCQRHLHARFFFCCPKRIPFSFVLYGSAQKKAARCLSCDRFGKYWWVCSLLFNILTITVLTFRKIHFYHFKMELFTIWLKCNWSAGQTIWCRPRLPRFFDGPDFPMVVAQSSFKRFTIATYSTVILDDSKSHNSSTWIIHIHERNSNPLNCC